MVHARFSPSEGDTIAEVDYKDGPVPALHLGLGARIRYWVRWAKGKAPRETILVQSTTWADTLSELDDAGRISIRQVAVGDHQDLVEIASTEQPKQRG
jgi:hypothetical protein